MNPRNLGDLITIAGIAQIGVLVASAIVPLHLDWKRELSSLKKLHRQMYWVYGGYVVLSIVALGSISVVNGQELSNGSLLSRSVCLYIAVFWGIRLLLQGVFDVKEHLTSWWLKLGYGMLTIIFTGLTILYAIAAIYPGLIG